MDILELIGYLASLLVAISLMMSSVLKLRWINLAGSATFSFYGFAIGSIPVGIMNFFIVLVNIYYLHRMYSKSDYFKLLPVSQYDALLHEFLGFYNEEIGRHFPDFVYKGDNHAQQFLILRNMAVAGIFLASREDDQTLKVDLDFVVPEYRDFKPGKYLYHSSQSVLRASGYNLVKTYPTGKTMRTYFRKVGFRPRDNQEQTWVLKIA